MPVVGSVASTHETPSPKGMDASNTTEMPFTPRLPLRLPTTGLLHATDQSEYGMYETRLATIMDLSLRCQLGTLGMHAEISQLIQLDIAIGILTSSFNY